MCWNAEASLVSGSTGMLICLFLLMRNDKGDKLYGFFFLWVLLMQWFEFAMWKDQECTGLNQAASQLAWIQNLLQPAVLILLTLALVPKTNKPIVWSTLVLYSVALCLWAAETKICSQELCTKGYSNGCRALNWPWVHGQPPWIWAAYFLACAIAALLLWPHAEYRWLVAGLGAFLLLSLCISRKDVGSWWCLFAVAIPLLYYVHFGAEAPCRRDAA